MVFHVVFSPDHEAGSDCMDAVKVGKIVVPAVEDILSTFLQRDMRHRLGIVNGSCRNMNKSRHLRLNII